MKRGMVKEGGPLNEKTLWTFLTAIFLISFGLIAFEVALSRFLSVLLSYHYVFIVLSLALLGLGLGGIFVHLFRPQIPSEKQRFGILAFLTSLLALAIPFSIILIVHIGDADRFQMNIQTFSFSKFSSFNPSSFSTRKNLDVHTGIPTCAVL